MKGPQEMTFLFYVCVKGLRKGVLYWRREVDIFFLFLK